MGYKRGVRPITSEKVETTASIKEEPIEKLVDGIIDGVDVALNIRKDPEIKPNNQIAILGKGVKIVVVDPDKTVKNKDGEWFKIRIKDADPKDPTGNGYALKKYIKII